MEQYISGGLFVALLSLLVLVALGGGNDLTSHAHGYIGGAKSVISLYKDFVLMKFPHGVAAIIGES